MDRRRNGALTALTIVALYAYDGLNRRIRKDVTNTGLAIVPGSDAGGAAGLKPSPARKQGVVRSGIKPSATRELG